MQQVKDPPEKEEREKVFLKSGVELTPELEEELAAEAERGYDLSRARRHYLEHSLLDESKDPKLTFSLSQAEFDAVRRRAKKEGRSLSDVVREALALYLKS